MEAAGIEPASEDIQKKNTTCLVSVLKFASDVAQRQAPSSTILKNLTRLLEAKSQASLLSGVFPPHRQRKVDVTAV